MLYDHSECSKKHICIGNMYASLHSLCILSTMHYAVPLLQNISSFASRSLFFLKSIPNRGSPWKGHCLIVHVDEGNGLVIIRHAVTNLLTRIIKTWFSNYRFTLCFPSNIINKFILTGSCIRAVCDNMWKILVTLLYIQSMYDLWNMYRFAEGRRKKRSKRVVRIG